MFFPSSPRTLLTASTSAALRINEANTISTPCATPNRRSLLNFDGMEIKYYMVTVYAMIVY